MPSSPSRATSTAKPSVSRRLAAMFSASRCSSSITATRTRPPLARSQNSSTLVSAGQPLAVRANCDLGLSGSTQDCSLVGDDFTASSHGLDLHNLRRLRSLNQRALHSGRQRIQGGFFFNLQNRAILCEGNILAVTVDRHLDFVFDLPAFHLL